MLSFHELRIMPNIKNAFALRDNPFRPVRLPKVLSDLKQDDLGLCQSLETMPLRLDMAPALLKLFCPFQRFEKYLKEFEKTIEQQGGYYQGDPGTQSLLFLIHGPQGSGKTTLSAAMIGRAKQYMSNGTRWHGFEPNSQSKTTSEQIKELTELEERIRKDTQAWDYCYVLIENIVDGSEVAVLDFYDRICKDRFVFMFLQTNDNNPLARSSNNLKHTINRYRTVSLTSKDASSFVRHRIKCFRDPNSEDELKTYPQLQNYPLFPFDEDDIKEVVETGVAAQAINTESTTLTIRQFSIILSKAINDALNDLPVDFNIAAVSPGEVGNNIIRLAPSFERMIS